MEANALSSEFAEDPLELFPPSEMNEQVENVEEHFPSSRPLPSLSKTNVILGDVRSTCDFDFLDNIYLNTSSLVELYRTNYLPIIRQNRQKLEDENEPGGLQYFRDNHFENCLTDEVVLADGNDKEVLRQMGSFFCRSEVKDPTFFEMLCFQGRKEMKLVEKCILNFSEDSRNADFDSSLEEEGEDSVRDGGGNFPGVHSRKENLWERDTLLDGDMLLISLSLSNIRTQTNEGLRVIFAKLRQSPQIAKELPATTIQLLLNDLSFFGECTSAQEGTASHSSSALEASMALTKTSLVFGIAGLIVSLRGDIYCILVYLDWMEKLSKKLETNNIRLKIPFANDIAESFSFCAKPSSLDYGATAPLGCFQYLQKQVPLPISVNREEGNMQCMAVSPDGNLLAAVFGSHLAVIDRDKGTVLHKTELDPKHLKLVWSICFSSSSRYVIATSKDGLHSVVYSSKELQLIKEERSLHEVPTLSTDYSEEKDEIRRVPAPFLSAGSRAALHFFQQCRGKKKVFDTPHLLHRISFAAFVAQDANFTLLTLEGTEALPLLLSVQVVNHMLVLSAFGKTSQAPLNATSKWIKLHIQWIEGRWSVSQNEVSLALHGVFSTGVTSITVQSCKVLEGTGHASSVGLWSSRDDSEERSVATRFFQRKPSLGVGLSLLYYPFDEGRGRWIKDLSNKRCTQFLHDNFVWDTAWTTSVSPDTYPSVSLDTDEFLSSQILVSKYSMYMLPSYDSPPGSGSAVITEVDKKTNSIVQLYSCLPSSSDNIYALRSDESEVIVSEKRFFTCRSIKILSRKALYQELTEMTPRNVEISTPGKGEGSPEWLLEEMSKRLVIFATEVQELKLCLWAPEEVNAIMEGINRISSATSVLRVMALLTLASAYFKRASSAQIKSIQLKPLDCKENLQAFTSMHTENEKLKKLAHDTQQLSLHCFFNMKQKAQIFFSVIQEKNWDLFFELFSEAPLVYMFLYLASQDRLSQLPSFTIELVKGFSANVFPASCAMEWITFYMISLVLVLQECQKTEILRDITNSMCDYLLQNIHVWSEETFDFHSKAKSIWITAIFPFFTALTRASPLFITPKLEHSLFLIIRYLQKCSSLPQQVISFDITSIHEVFPSPPLTSLKEEWCFTEDFSHAKSVVILKEDNALPFGMLSQEKKLLDSKFQVIKKKATTTSGNVKVFMGTARATITTIGHYEIRLHNSIGANVLECVQQVLLSLAREYFFSIPRSNKFIVPLAFRHGLTTDSLKKHGIHIPHRERISTYSLEILEGRGDGKVLVDSVCNRMRGSILPSMKPAIQSLLAILIHCGATEREAEKELRLTWFSGNWGINFQGPQREPALQQLHEIATWVVHNIFFELTSRASLNRSASRYSQTSSYGGITTAQYSVFKDLLTVVRSALAMGEAMGGAPMERVMAQHTRKALNFFHGVEILRQLVLDDQGRGTAVSESIKILIRYTEQYKEIHLLESVFGAGLELEYQVRSSFHSLLKTVTNILLQEVKTRPSTTLECLQTVMPNGLNILRLLTLYTYSWDEEDYGQLVTGDGSPQSRSSPNTPISGQDSCVSIVNGLRLLLQIPFEREEKRLSSTEKRASSAQMEYINGLPEAEFQTLYRECFAALNIRSTGFSTPNTFSVSIPLLNVKNTEGVFQIRKTSESALFLRADEPWKTVFENRKYFTEYFEVQLLTGVSGTLQIGLASGNANPHDPSGSFIFSISSDGQLFPSIRTEDQSISAKSGDIIGCGFHNSSKKFFCTRNGVFWRCGGAIDVNVKYVFPALFFSEGQGIDVKVNFGGAPFVFDHSQMHPAYCGNGGPTWFNVFCAVELAFLSLTTRVCSISLVKDDEDVMYFAKLCCDVACKKINNATDAITFATPNPATNYETLCKAVLFRTAENAILLQISVLKHFFALEHALSGEMQAMWRNIYYTMLLVIHIPLHSTLLASLRLLRSTIKQISNLSHGDCSALVKKLFLLAEKEEPSNVDIPFKVTWDICDPQNISTMTDTYAITLPRAKVSVITGSVLPSTEAFSFSVTVTKRDCPKGRSLQSGYYVGVAKKGSYPSDVLQSWKAKRPPVVWAIHDISPQLPHATNPSVTPNAFMRAFGSDERIKICVDREAGKISFFREGQFLSELFVGVPQDVDLVPFVQLYNENAIVSLHEGTMTAPITESALLSSAAVSVLQVMLRVNLFQSIVAKYLTKEMAQKMHAKVTFAVLNALPDPRNLMLCSKFEEDIPVKILDVDQDTYYYIRNKAISRDHSYKFRIPRKANINCRFAFQPHESITGTSLCIEGLVDTLMRHSNSILGKNALMIREMVGRGKIIEEEAKFFDILNESLRVGLFSAIRLLSLDGLVPSTPEYEYVFSSTLSNPNMQVLPQYLGKLIRLDDNAPTLTSFIGICDPPIPDKGIVNIRCRIRRGDDTHALGGGYYFGVCTENVNWKCADFARMDDSSPQVWALHDADSPIWRLKHMIHDVHFSDNICFRSGDTIRLEINRETGTMHAFRKPFMGDETIIGLIFTHIPNERLRPFVCLYNNDASAVLLPSNSDLVPVRVTKQKTQYAFYDYTQKVYCSSCSMNQAEEVQLSHRDWYKCNECTNYALCPDCFYGCIHSHHVFSYMHSKTATTYCSSPPWKVFPGLPIFIPSGPIFYLKSHGCALPEENIDCVAISSAENAYTCWGLIGKPGRFSISVHFTQSSSGGTLQRLEQQDAPLFVGFTTKKEILSMNPVEFRSFVVNNCSASSQSETVVVCSDPFFDERGSSSSFPGLHDGCNIQFVLDWKNKFINVSKNAVFHRSAPFYLPHDSEGLKSTHLLCFVMFSAKGQSSVIFPDQNRGTGAIVTEVKGSLVKVKIPHSGIRMVSKDQCRVPLVPLIFQQEMLESLKRQKYGRTRHIGYFFKENRIAECHLASVSSKNEVTIFEGHNIKKSQQMPAVNILVDPYRAPKTPQRQLNFLNGLGPTVAKSSSILKILIILSSMCRHPALSKIISPHKSKILPVLYGLSSHMPSHPSSMDVIQNIRTTLQKPSLWFRVPKTNDFIPQLQAKVVNEEESIHNLPPGTVVSLFGCAKKNTLYRIEGFNTVENKFELVPFKPTGVERKEASVAHIHDSTDIVLEDPSCCIPVKMSSSATTVWCEHPDGLPSSKRELVLRKANRENPFCNASLQGEWRGTISYQNSSLGVEMSLTQEGTFHSSKALLHSRNGIKVFTIWYEYFRYERYVRICMLEPDRFPERVWSVGNFNELALLLENTGILGKTAYIIKGNIDYSGTHFIGSYRASDGTLGSVLARMVTRISFVSESPEDIEVLPECSDNDREQKEGGINRVSLLSNALVMLCRHLYMTLCYQSPGNFKDFIDNISLFHRHPLGIEVAKHFSSVESLRLLQKVSFLIKNPETNPLESASLAKFLLAPLENASFVDNCPTFFLWETLHAVVFAAHRCGPRLRPQVLAALARFVSCYPSLKWEFNYASLLSPLVSHANYKLELEVQQENMREYKANEEVRDSLHHDISSIVHLLVCPTQWPRIDVMENIPLSILHCLLDLRQSIENHQPVPLAVVEREGGKHEKPIALKCLFGELVDQNFLKIGKAVGQCTIPRKKVYFEVVLSKDEIGTYAIGWGTEQHRRAADTHVGTDAYSFAFLGTSVSFAGAHSRYEIPFSPFLGMKQGLVIGCMLDLLTGVAAWSRNGVPGPFLPIPQTHLARDPLFAFASMNGGSGLSMLLDANEFLYPPDDYHDISGKRCVPHVIYDPSFRSTLPSQPKEFYIQLGAYLSAGTIARTTREVPPPNITSFPLVAAMEEPKHLHDYMNVISFIEQGVYATERFIDLHSEKLHGRLASTFLYFKPFLREFSRLRLINFEPLTSVTNAKEIVIRVQQASSNDSITPQNTDFMSQTVFFQCFKQLADLRDEQWDTTPLFKVHLHLSGSGHSPIDMGGPYRQTWSLMSQELMQDPQLLHGDSTFVKQSLFRFCNNSLHISLVPDETLTSPAMIALFTFFGKLMGYAAKAQLPLDIEFSPFVWRYIVDDELKIEDYYMYVDSVIKSSMEDQEIFSNGMAEELIPGFKEKLEKLATLRCSSSKPDDILLQKQKIAQDCLLHSMDAQLRAIKLGLWKVLSPRVLRCLYWRDLEELVCGVSNPTVKSLKKYIKCNLTATREAFFWEIVEEMTPEQKSGLLCFASGQRRLPLIRLISVVENSESEFHLPRAQSCSSLITIPPYQTFQRFREKLLHAIQHQNEMELA